MVDAATGVITFETEMPGWQGTPVKALLEAATGLPVEINNDANCAALAEARLGAAAGFNQRSLPNSRNKAGWRHSA